jgi:integrase
VVALPAFPAVHDAGADASGWRDFLAFCAERGLSALPASDQTVALYLSAVADLKKMLETLPGTQVGLRDRAVLLLGFAGAFRRSELVSLDVADLDFSSAGLIVTLRKSKTDQEGASRRIGIPFGSSEATCPVRAV